MAGNQREMRKKELKAKKDRKNKTIIWIIIAIVVAVLIVMKVCEININTVKEHFTDSSGKLSISQNVEKNNFSYNLDSSQNVTVKNINNKLGVLTPSTFTFIDTKYPEIPESIAKDKVISEEMEEKLIKALGEFKAEFK